MTWPYAMAQPESSCCTIKHGIDGGGRGAAGKNMTVLPLPIVTKKRVVDVRVAQ
jgi:hypothetical protein